MPEEKKDLRGPEGSEIHSVHDYRADPNDPNSQYFMVVPPSEDPHAPRNMPFIEGAKRFKTRQEAQQHMLDLMRGLVMPEYDERSLWSPEQYNKWLVQKNEGASDDELLGDWAPDPTRTETPQRSDYEVVAPEKTSSREPYSLLGPWKGVQYFSNKSTRGELTPMHKGKTYNYPRSTDPSRVYEGAGKNGKPMWSEPPGPNPYPGLLDPSWLFPAPPGMFYPPNR